ncbi:MAG: hypothetical protein QS721_09180 [Candidatus Endonucleobacter sp. (ex Gigantidas childressi)]|nr:hypothetical protein [Candidatus Endonucleobacter sp. (ex Gigantidas childressi)]
MIRTKKNITGFVLPVAMALMSVLTFSMLGVMESSKIEEKKAGNQQWQLMVEQVARSELDTQLEKIEYTKDLLSEDKSHNLTPTLYKDGCSSKAKDAICQTVKLVYLSRLAIPAQLIVLNLEEDQYLARHFKIYSKAEHLKSGAMSEVYSELRSVQLELWMPDNVPLGRNIQTNRDQLMADIGFYLPDWWEVTVVKTPFPWRFACIAASNSILNFFPGVIGIIANYLSKGFLTEAKCTATYISPSGKREYVSSPNFGGGGSWIIEVPRRSTNVQFYWHAWVIPGAADDDCFLFECLWPAWRRLKFRQFEYNMDGRSPDPIDRCTILHGGFWQVHTNTCGYTWAEGAVKNKRIGAK